MSLLLFFEFILDYRFDLLLIYCDLYAFSPVNLVDSYENRFAFACAFGATTTKCISILFGGGYSQVFSREMAAWIESPEVPSYTASKHVIFCFEIENYLWEARWPNGWCAGLRIERSVFEPWPGHCVVFLGKTLYSHGASLHPGV